MIDGTVAPGHEVVHGPGQLDSTVRYCANPDCDRQIRPEDARSKQYCEPRCRTAAWKARKAEQAENPLYAVDGATGTVTLLRGAGDAENARTGPGSKRAAELRELRKHGPVASDRRVQVSRATESVARMLVDFGLVPSMEAARYYAGIAVSEALPTRFRR